jgi:hypothetical protein
MKGRNMRTFQILCRSAIIIAVWNGFSALATVYQSDGSAASVQGLQNAALDGDTITLPAGTFQWTGHVTITKAITLQGQTTVAGDHTTPVITATDQTTIVDNISPRGQIMGISVATGKVTRISGITFSGVGGSNIASANGALRVSGLGQIRIDHCHFTALWQINAVAFYARIYGVMDHCVVDNPPPQMMQQRAFNGTAGTGGSGNGDLEFSQPMGYGGPNFIFMEDCYLNNNTGNAGLANCGWDSAWGGKYVLRYNKLFNVIYLNHGTEEGRNRGGRGYEAYNNDHVFSTSTGLDGLRTGSIVVHDNTYSGVQPSSYGMRYYRSIYGYGGGPNNGQSTWGGATGDNAWDLNDPVLYASGTSTSGTNETALVDTTKNWTTNQWVGYNVKKVSDGSTAYITANTATTLTFFEWNPQGWASGQAYQIHKTLVAIDQACRGQGDLLTGAAPTPRWLNQVREPCYSWNNIHSPSGNHINFVTTTLPAVTAGVDYFEDTAMPGYTPYAYPHPLVTGGPIPTPSPAPSATASATATAAPSPTATPAATPTPLPTSTPTATPIPTATPTATATPRHTPRPRPSHAPDQG